MEIFIGKIIDDMKTEEVDDTFSILDFIKDKMSIYFNIIKEEIEDIMDDTDNEKYKEYNDEKEFSNITNIINNNGTANDFEKQDYIKLKYIFFNKEKIIQPYKDLEEIYKIILDSIDKSINEFFNWENVEHLFKAFIQYIEKIFENEEERELYKRMCNDLLQSFKRELELKKQMERMEWNIKKLNPLKNIIDSLIKLDPNNDSLMKLKNDYCSLSYFIYNYRRFRIALLGGYSTGKSSFLNSLIGCNILPVDINRCTNKGIIIRHNKDKEYPQLFRTKFTKVNDPEYWFFSDEEKPICEGYEDIKKKISRIKL